MAIDGSNLWSGYFYKEWERIEKEALSLLNDEGDKENGDLPLPPYSECEEGACKVNFTQKAEQPDTRQADQNLSHFASRLQAENKALISKAESSPSMPIAKDSVLYPIFCYQLDLSGLFDSEQASPVSLPSAGSSFEQKDGHNNRSSYFSQNLFHQ